MSTEATRLPVAVIATVLNEAATISALLEALCTQSRLPDEVVIVDGGSTDATPDIIQSYQDRLPLRLIHATGCNISQGRNRAIQAATSPIIAATDAGVRIPEDWLARLTAPFTEDTTQDTAIAQATTQETPQNAPQVVAGFFYADPDPHDAFEVAMSATVLPLLDEIDPQSFLPSSRSIAFSKSAWEAVGGYPEWLDYCEDLIFDLRLQAHYAPFAFAPEAYVYFKPRQNLRSFFKQYYRYARGDGKSDLWRKRHLIRYATYLGVVPGVAALMIRFSPAWGLLYALGGAVYLGQAYRRLPKLWPNLTLKAKVLAIMYVPLIRVVGDVAKMLGYPVGKKWRRHNQPPAWR